MNYVFTLLLIGFAIIFHECGHYLAARIAKVPIKTFSVGFGPAIWKRQIGETEYRISWIPMGGYVLPAIEDEDQFFKIPVNKRIVMTIGGPLASALLPVICLSILNTYSMGFSFLGTLIHPFQKSWAMGYQMMASLPQLFSAPGQIMGIVGIVAQGGNFVSGSFLKSLQFLAMISMNLCIINLLPIPALDGGKLLMYLGEKVHPRFVKLHIPFSIAGWVFIIGITVYTVIIDVVTLTV
jgi:regulator of sigma E protease